MTDPRYTIITAHGRNCPTCDDAARRAVDHCVATGSSGCRLTSNGQHVATVTLRES